MTNCASKDKGESLRYSEKIFSQQAFIPHEGRGPMKSWLGMNLNAPPFEDLLRQVEGREGKKLLSRGEAHITVISPVEYDHALAAKISMAEINALALKMKIQESSFKPICVGRGQATLAGHPEETYYVVVSAEKLFQIRQAVANLFRSRGGKKEAFDPDLFYPHVTLGFTKRDLFNEDGVIKDERSCIAHLQPMTQ